MKKLIIYPFEKEISDIARYREILEEYKLVNIVAPKGWGLGGKESSKLDGGEKTGMIISEQFEKALEECDTVFFNDTKSQALFYTYLDKIRVAYERNKEILMTKALYERLSLNEKLDFDVNIVNTPMNYYDDFLNKEYRYKLYKINTPIIGVFGIGDYCNKFDIQLELRKKFIKDGYRVSQLGTKQYSTLFGFPSLPEFIFSSDMSMEEKILSFNHYIHYIEHKENPDIIILGIPGGIMPLSDEYTNYFGELSLIISKAVPIDVSILSMYYTKELEIKILNDIKLYFKYALQCSVDYFNLTNIKYERDPSSGDVYYTTMDNQKVSKFISKQGELYKIHNINLFSVLDQSAFENIYNCIIKELAEGILQI